MSRLNTSGGAGRWMLLVSCILALPAHAITLGSGGDPRPVDLNQTFNLDAPAATEAQTYVVTAGSGRFEKIKRVAILNFCTQFVFSKSAQGVSSGSTIAYSRASEGGIPLDLASMTTVADTLYEQIEASLRAAGVEVVPHEVLAADPAFQKYAKNFVSGPQQIDLTGKASKNSWIEGQVVAISAKGRPFSTDCRVENPGQTGDRIQLSYQLKDVYLLSVNSVIDFAKATAKGGLFSGAKSDLVFGEYIVPGATQYHFTGIMQPLYLNVWLKQAIVPVRNPFAVGAAGSSGVESESSADGSRTSVTRTASSAVDFDQSLYYSNATQYLGAMNDMFMSVLTSH